MMEIQVGQAYFGPGRARRVVVEVTADSVVYLLPISCRQETAARPDFEAWVAEGAE